MDERDASRQASSPSQSQDRGKNASRETQQSSSFSSSADSSSSSQHSQANGVPSRSSNTGSHDADAERNTVGTSITGGPAEAGGSGATSGVVSDAVATATVEYIDLNRKRQDRNQITDAIMGVLHQNGQNMPVSPCHDALRKWEDEPRDNEPFNDVGSVARGQRITGPNHSLSYNSNTDGHRNGSEELSDTGATGRRTDTRQ